MYFFGRFLLPVHPLIVIYVSKALKQRLRLLPILAQVVRRLVHGAANGKGRAPHGAPFIAV